MIVVDPHAVITTTTTSRELLTDIEETTTAITVIVECPDCGMKHEHHGPGRHYPEHPEPVFKCWNCRERYRVNLEAAGLRLEGHDYVKITF